MSTAPRIATTTAVHVGEVAGEQAERDAGDGDVADAVAQQGQPPLHEEGADRGRGQPGEEGGEQRPLHEVAAQEVEELGEAHRPPSRGSCDIVSKGEPTWGTWSCRGVDRVVVAVHVLVRERRSRRRRSGRRA